ncbi:MFS transporter [Bacillus thuringiensis serovar roskildiensis]|uniref:MFS transporter n=1 Tax=Bacillus thuringiensis serovar sooncheon TaxID=180891 RepID=A0A9Q5SD26_BACTU|nr:MFS transporter [Bacillus thuringiensis]MEB9661623.1 MFS transporter [Bacillus cereus]ARV91122.1 MFS transporter [Bacillus thuringiensis]OTW68811.1 MFS transporter [Bacillus thuringiensis serovar coreanensis]OTX42693.1 MFS transporter [Bacillus thuringiensis serovar sooncheon]OTX54419.1 MFS transporter [Bacillus thuringiensis serovar guiyangiensis]
MNRVKSSASFLLYLLCISAFFASLNQNIYSPIIPIIRDSFQVSITMVNLSVSIFIFITAIMQIVFGSIMDFKGARTILIPSIILTIIASIGCAITSNFTVFLICRILQAVGTAAIPLIAATTIGSVFQGEQRGSAMGTYQTMLSIAPAVAPVLGGFIGEKYNYPGVFWLLVAVSVILFITNWMYFPKDRIGSKKELSGKTIISHYASIFKSKVGSSILILSFFAFFLYFSFIVYLPILLTDHYQLSLQVVGLLYLPMAISLIIGSMTFKTIQSKISQKKLFITGNVVLALSVILFAVTHSKTLIGVTVALILHGISIGILTPLFATMIANEFEHNRGSAMGMFNFIRYMGMAVGPIVSGLLLAHFQPTFVFALFGGFFIFLSFGMLIRISKRSIKIVSKQENLK